MMHIRKRFSKGHNFLICIFITISVIIVYSQVRNHDSIDFDDDIYVFENSQVNTGLSFENIKWAFSFSSDNTYWHPVTWLSHMLDCQLFGLNAGAHHISNLIIHIINSLLLFFALRYMTGATWRSGLVAALFALHPLNVDSVAWIAERKNLLSTFFWILTIICYVYYSRKTHVFGYVLTFLVFTLGLLSKPMLITLPCVLLLLDFWPLNRLTLFLKQKNGHGFFSGNTPVAPLSRLVLEKVPLLVLSLIIVWISMASLHNIDVVVSAEKVPMALRISNALVSYIAYLSKIFWPQNLAIYYPFPKSIPLWQSGIATIILIAISMIALRQLRNRPYLIVGWLWFLGTLVPVSGLVQGGLWPALADRWAYVPQIGIFVAVVWFVADIVHEKSKGRIVFFFTAISICLILAVVSFIQTKHWKDSISIFEHALKVADKDDDTSIIHYNLGCYYRKKDKNDEAIEHFKDVVRINPFYTTAYNNLGACLKKKGEKDEAISYFLKAVSINPNYDLAYYNLANCFFEIGKYEEAIINYNNISNQKNNFWKDAKVKIGMCLVSMNNYDTAIDHFNKVLSIRPDMAEAHNALAMIFTKLQKFDDSIYHFNKALIINPEYAEAHYNFGLELSKKRKFDEAVKHLTKAVQISPDKDIWHNNLGFALAAEGCHKEAVAHYKTAIDLNPRYSEAYFNMGVSRAKMGDLEKAVYYYLKTLEINPDHASAHANLGTVFAMRGDLDKAIEHFYTALKLQPDNKIVMRNLEITKENRDKKINIEMEKAQKALIKNPDSLENCYTLANLYLKKKMYGEALSEYQKVINIKSDFIPALYEMAIVYMNTEEYDMAIKTFKDMISIQPENNLIYYNIACVYSKNNNVDDSVEWLKKAVNKGYDNWEHIQKDKDLENIRATEYYRKLTENIKTISPEVS